MGKGGGGGTAAGHLGEQVAMNLMRSGAKSRKLVFSQLKEALKTGNIEARIPIIQAQVEQGLQQGSEAMKVAQTDVAKSGAGRSPAAQEQLAVTRSMAERAVASIPSEVIGQTLRSGPDALAGPTNTALGLLGVANQASAAAGAAKAQNQAAAMSTAGAGAGAAIAIIAAI